MCSLPPDVYPGEVTLDVPGAVPVVEAVEGLAGGGRAQHQVMIPGVGRGPHAVTQQRWEIRD